MGADLLRPLHHPRWRPFQVSLMALGPMFMVRNDLFPATTAHMRCHAHAVMQDLYRRRRRADLHGFLHQVVGHAVKVSVERHVVVDVHARPRPFAALESIWISTVVAVERISTASCTRL